MNKRPGLERQHRVLRDRLRRAVNALDAYERLLLSKAMGGPDAPLKHTTTMQVINSCLAHITTYLRTQPYDD